MIPLSRERSQGGHIQYMYLHQCRVAAPAASNNCTIRSGVQEL